MNEPSSSTSLAVGTQKMLSWENNWLPCGTLTICSCNKEGLSNDKEGFSNDKEDFFLNDKQSFSYDKEDF